MKKIHKRIKLVLWKKYYKEKIYFPVKYLNIFLIKKIWRAYFKKRKILCIKFNNNDSILYKIESLLLKVCKLFFKIDFLEYFNFNNEILALKFILSINFKAKISLLKLKNIYFNLSKYAIYIIKYIILYKTFTLKNIICELWIKFRVNLKGFYKLVNILNDVHLMFIRNVSIKSLLSISKNKESKKLKQFKLIKSQLFNKFSKIKYWRNLFNLNKFFITHLKFLKILNELQFKINCDKLISNLVDNIKLFMLNLNKLVKSFK